MRKELEQKFQTRWPEWFRDLYGDVTQTCLHFGFQHRDAGSIWSGDVRANRKGRGGGDTLLRSPRSKRNSVDCASTLRVVTTLSAPVLRLPRRSPSIFARCVASREP
jgi:hypothetical protein